MVVQTFKNENGLTAVLRLFDKHFQVELLGKRSNYYNADKERVKNTLKDLNMRCVKSELFQDDYLGQQSYRKLERLNRQTHALKR